MKQNRRRDWRHTLRLQGAALAVWFGRMTEKWSMTDWVLFPFAVTLVLCASSFLLYGTVWIGKETLKLLK